MPKAKISQYDSTASELFTYSVNAGWTALADTTVDEQDYIERVYYYSSNYAEYYGQYVDLGTDLIEIEGTEHKADWRIFYKDEEKDGIW